MMSSSIDSTGFNSLTPDRLSLALMKQFMGQIPQGSSVTFRYGDNNKSGLVSWATIVPLSPATTAATPLDISVLGDLS